MAEQEKLEILINYFKKLEESQKEYFRELVQKLAEINCGGFESERGKTAVCVGGIK
ncbi:MAG: hypothetical protein LBH44_04120 [Treponema sp.]|jgi:uncharacterized membrane protein YvbJ|nr:hypothetical protein [Treponema sp.]